MIISASDNQFGQSGGVGIGSYNDCAYFDDICVIENAAEEDETELTENLHE